MRAGKVDLHVRRIYLPAAAFAAFVVVVFHCIVVGLFGSAPVIAERFIGHRLDDEEHEILKQKCAIKSLNAQADTCQHARKKKLPRK